MPNVKLISATPDAEKTMAYIAKVSNPANQDSDKFHRLLAYCIKNEHWSVFEQAHMTLEVTTTRARSTQILRHRSFTFQEFSQRYATVDALPSFEPDSSSSTRSVLMVGKTWYLLTTR